MQSRGGGFCCRDELTPYVPTPVVEEREDGVIPLATPERGIDHSRSSTATSAFSSVPAPTYARSHLMACPPYPVRRCSKPNTCACPSGGGC